MSEDRTNVSPDGGDQGAGTAAAVRRVLFWAGVAGFCAIATYAVIRAATHRVPNDPTSERIQSLIDEANRLLRTLDDKKHG